MWGALIVIGLAALGGLIGLLIFKKKESTVEQDDEKYKKAQSV